MSMLIKILNEYIFRSFLRYSAFSAKIIYRHGKKWQIGKLGSRFFHGNYNLLFTVFKERTCSKNIFNRTQVCLHVLNLFKFRHSINARVFCNAEMEIGVHNRVWN